MRLVVWLIAVLLGVFALTGAVAFAREVLRLWRSRGPSDATVGDRYDRYIGAIDRSAAPLTPGLRVGVEFLAGLCGFPGLGWMVSGRVKAGLPLIIIVPALMWAFFPLWVSFSGTVFAQPLAVFAVLPVAALVSAAGLAVFEMRRGPAR